MDSTLVEYLKTDLYSELRWLLCAATEWDAYDKLIGEPPQVPKIKEPCFHLKVYTMDSALFHARCLYEFFTAKESAIKRNEKNGLKRLTWRDYSSNGRQESKKYDKFMKPLHGRAMHIEKDRAGFDEVKKEVVNFAVDVLDLWECFSRNADLVLYAGLLDHCRKEAIGEATKIAGQYKELGYKSPFP